MSKNPLITRESARFQNYFPIISITIKHEKQGENKYRETRLLLNVIYFERSDFRIRAPFS